MTYNAFCTRCSSQFDALGAEWCQCVRPVRSVRCTHCGECLCSRPSPYKRSFWANAPDELRQNPKRFGMERAAVVDLPVNAPRADAPGVVIVDDDESTRSLVACYVGQLGYRALVAANPHDAYVLAHDEGVEAVITDALMPGMDGRELSRRLKTSPGTRNRKVIVMTSLYTARRFRSEAFNVFGVDEYLSKPLNLVTLGHALSRLVPVRRANARPKFAQAR